MINKLLLCFILTILVSCGDDPESGDGKITSTFTDSSVTSFLQTSNIARTNPSEKEKFFNLIIPEALAAGGQGEISCFSGDSVDFDITTNIGSVTNSNSVTATCGSDIQLKIRQGLLEGLKDVAIYRTTTDASYKKGLLNFRSSAPNAGTYGAGFVWGAPYQVKTLTDPCYDTYTFTESTGTVEIKPAFTSNLGTGTCLCDDANMGDPAHPDYNSDCRTVTATFRFIDGTMELDLTNSNNYDNTLSTYEKWEECASIADASTCN